MDLAVEGEIHPVRKVARVVILFEQEQSVRQTAYVGQVQFAIGGTEARLELRGGFVLPPSSLTWARMPERVVL